MSSFQEFQGITGLSSHGVDAALSSSADLSTGQDRIRLENWRRISLINVDANIASKVISTRVIKVLPEIIHCTQTGYVKGRFIS